MYKLLLTIRYLRRKLIPWFALAAVTLCVAMLIIVLSIMGGFHNLLLGSGTKLMGDVRLSAGTQGIREYQAVLDAVRKLPQTKAATATIETWGLLKNPSGASTVVEVVGIDPSQMSGVTDYAGTVYWNDEHIAELPRKVQAYERELESLNQRIRQMLDDRDLAVNHNDIAKAEQINHDLEPLSERMNYLTLALLGTDELIRYYKDPTTAQVAQELKDPGEGSPRPSPMVIGLEVNRDNARTNEGTYDHLSPWVGTKLSLTLVPVTQAGDFADRSVQQFEVVNEFYSGLFDVDRDRVFIPFAVAQRMLLMDEAEQVDPDDPFTVIGTKPARASAIIVRAAEGISSEQLQTEVRRCYARLLEENPQLPYYVRIDTWMDLMRDMLNTVKNEKSMMAFLFGIISFVAVILVLVIFYMIVLEKTRDIGILRAVGASRTGVASIFLLYAGFIGSIGSLAGTVIGVLFVTYINEIHTWLGDGFGCVGFLVGLAAVLAITGTLIATVVGFSAKKLGPIVARGMLIGGTTGLAIGGILLLSIDGLADNLNKMLSIQIWDRKVYFFEEIPNRVEPMEVAVIVLVAIVASVLGAGIPALLAARVDPVESLRYE